MRGFDSRYPLQPSACPEAVRRGGVEHDAVARPIRRDRATLDDAHRLGDDAVAPEAVHLEMGEVTGRLNASASVATFMNTVTPPPHGLPERLDPVGVPADDHGGEIVADQRQHRGTAGVHRVGVAEPGRAVGIRDGDGGKPGMRDRVVRAVRERHGQGNPVR